MNSAMAGPWLRALRRYVVVAAAGHLVWEFAQMPLYTLWTTGTPRAIVAAALHCTGGDLLIAVSSLVAALLLVGENGWPALRFRSVAALTIANGIAYTVFSEWLNVTVRASWAYSDRMPTLTVGDFELGISPLLQWIVIPVLALRVARSDWGKAEQVPAIVVRSSDADERGAR